MLTLIIMGVATRKSCPVCGNKEGMEHVACIKCGHVFKDEETAIRHNNYSYLNDSNNRNVNESDVSYLEVKEKTYAPNNTKLARSIVAAFIMIVLIIAVIVVQMLLKKDCEVIETEIKPTIYVFLGLLLVLPWLFFISFKIANDNLKSIRELEHKDNLSKIGKIISIVVAIFSILLVLGALALLVIDCVQIIPVIIQSFAPPAS